MKVGWASLLRLTDDACCPDCPGIPGPGTAAAMPPFGERDSSELKPLNAYPACVCIRNGVYCSVDGSACMRCRGRPTLQGRADESCLRRCFLSGVEFTARSTGVVESSHHTCCFILASSGSPCAWEAASCCSACCSAGSCSPCAPCCSTAAPAQGKAVLGPVVSPTVCSVAFQSRGYVGSLYGWQRGMHLQEAAPVRVITSKGDVYHLGQGSLVLYEPPCSWPARLFLVSLHPSRCMAQIVH